VKFSLIALGLCWIATAATAQVEIPTNVAQVESGGYWNHDGRSGRFRIVIADEGWEHVISRIFIEWIEQDGEGRGRDKVVARVEPTTGEMISFRATLSWAVPGSVRIAVEGVYTHMLEKRVTGEIDATTPGTVRRISALRETK